MFGSPMLASNTSSVGPSDFSKPWKFSDVVLVVEDQKFHVHRSTLSIWSPVFETMFTSMFKEKNMNEIPLPGKKESEIKELLLIIYSTASETGWKSVTNDIATSWSSSPMSIRWTLINNSFLTVAMIL